MSILWPLSVNLESTEQLHSALTINYQARSADPVTARRVARYSPCSPKTPERSSASYVLTTANGSPRRTSMMATYWEIYSPPPIFQPKNLLPAKTLPLSNQLTRQTVASLVLAPGLRGPVFDIGAGQQGGQSVCVRRLGRLGRVEARERLDYLGGQIHPRQLAVTVLGIHFLPRSISTVASAASLDHSYMSSNRKSPSPVSAPQRSPLTPSKEVKSRSSAVP